ncbi:MAG TPA: DedA family protein [Herpetosiphon sp.]|uniref:SNARE associated Golgi protein n=1 Tax=Herpetosiphon aurantiacus (strain ATCC 23779 / DSM 785 / 114-95) TaxID=316274 RepID=A9B3P1_HERA2|nr:DedA family protein [Herpetosiphon sp.]ABX05613.1 SNARE associated Golgi protein [Herpetosiphon aurantiacus DSM 785]HBW52161.1 DedA family protein [Herpetosiphon sp.]
MSEIMDKVQAIITAIITALSYPGIALVMFAENLFPPIPSELVMPFAGFIVGKGEMNLVAVLLAGTIGAVLGALALYYIGMWADETIIRRFIRRYGKFFFISEADIDKTLGFFAKYGEIVVFTGRLIPLVRSLISIPAGMNRMPMGRFLLWTTFGSLIWNGLLTYAGIVLGSQWENVLGLVDRYEKVALGIIALGLIWFVVNRMLKVRRNRAASKQV